MDERLIFLQLWYYVKDKRPTHFESSPQTIFDVYPFFACRAFNPPPLYFKIGLGSYF